MTGEELVAAIEEAYVKLLHPEPPEPVCACGAITAIQHGGGFGFVCNNGHRLPGQDM